MQEPIDALVNPEMILWARLKSGFDIIGAAKRIGVKPDRLAEWETGSRRPTILQAIKMAEVYKRPLSAFYLDETPSDTSIPLTDFRRLPESEAKLPSPALIWEQRQAEMRRSLMIELAEDDQVGEFPYKNGIARTDNIEDAAHAARDLLGVTWDQQYRWQEPSEAWNRWRTVIEAQNVLVFQTNASARALDLPEARGFSIASDRFPVITVNSLDSPRGRIFTLLHEYAHLLLDAGGICDCWEYSAVTTEEARLEVFCNHVAASILMPASLLLAHEEVRKHGDNVHWTDAEIERLSQDFSVSQESVVRRLLTLGLTDITFYQSKRAEYSEKFREYKKRIAEQEEKQGIPPYHRMLLSRIGKPFARQVLTAYHERLITLSDASEYMGAKVKFVKRIEAEIVSIGI